MNSRNVLAIVLAGGEGTRLRPLTAKHAKPALPFAAGYRIVDFVLSNLVNSGVASIYVIAQYKPQSLIHHVECAWGNVQGRDAFVRTVLPENDGARYLGTADAVYRNLHLVERHRPDLIAVFAADHVYRMDVRQMVDFHRGRDAEVSVAALPVPLREAPSFGVIVSQPDGRIRDFQEKPHRPAPLPADPTRAFASMGNYLFRPEVLVDILQTAHERGDNDFGRHVLPAAVSTRRMFAYDFTDNHVPGLQPFEEDCYWRDVGTLEAYAAARLDVRGPTPRFCLANPDWPIRSSARGMTSPRSKGRAVRLGYGLSEYAPRLISGGRAV